MLIALNRDKIDIKKKKILALDSPQLLKYAQWIV
jgi:hypothetical protein